MKGKSFRIYPITVYSEFICPLLYLSSIEMRSRSGNTERKNQFIMFFCFIYNIQCVSFALTLGIGLLSAYFFRLLAAKVFYRVSPKNEALKIGLGVKVKSDFWKIDESSNPISQETFFPKKLGLIHNFAWHPCTESSATQDYSQITLI